MWPLLEFSFEDVLNQWKTSRVLTDTTIVIPIFCANHWFLGIIDINNKSNPTVGIYDSKHQDRPAEGLLLGRIASFLTSRPSTFIKLDGPYQSDSYNCGIFLVLGAEHLLRNTQNGNTQWFSLNDVNLLRKSMVSYIEKSALENLSSSSPDRLISEDLKYNSLCLDSSFILSSLFLQLNQMNKIQP